MLTPKKRSFLLSTETIDILAMEFALSLNEAGVNRDDVMRLRLAVEEILEEFQDILPRAPATFIAGKKFPGKQFVEIDIEGREVHFERGIMEEAALSDRMLTDSGLRLERFYKNDCNCLAVYPPKR